MSISIAICEVVIIECEITLLLNDKQDRIAQVNLSLMSISIAICEMVIIGSEITLLLSDK